MADNDKPKGITTLRRRIEDALRKQPDIEKMVKVAKLYDVKTDDLDLTPKQS